MYDLHQMPIAEAVPLQREMSVQIDLTAETQFDDAARLASAICRTPSSMVMLLQPPGRWTRVSGDLRLRELDELINLQRDCSPWGCPDR